MAPTLDPAGQPLPALATDTDVARLLELWRAARVADRRFFTVDELEEAMARLDAARAASEAVLAQYLPAPRT